MPKDKTPEDLGIFHGRRVTGDDFWKLKIKDDDELKTRYCEYQSEIAVNEKVDLLREHVRCADDGLALCPVQGDPH